MGGTFRKVTLPPQLPKPKIIFFLKRLDQCGFYFNHLMKHRATSRKLEVLISDEFTGFSNWSNPSSRTMALCSTQSLTEMSTRNLPGSKGRPVGA
jgi:hypothetical protein